MLKYIIFFLIFLSISCSSIAYALDVGDICRDFALRDSNGRVVTFSSLREDSTVTVLEFISIYCDACRKKVSQLNDLAAKYDSRKVKIIAVALANEQPEIDAETAQWGARYPLLADPDKTTFYLYGIHNVPQFFIIDGAGIIRYSGNAENFKDIENNIEKLLSRGTTFLQAGDPAPPLLLPDSKGKPTPVDFSAASAGTLLAFFTADIQKNREQAALIDTILKKAPALSPSICGIISAAFQGADDQLIRDCSACTFLVDAGGTVFRQFGITSAPELIIITKSGRIRMRNAPQNPEPLLRLFQEQESSTAPLDEEEQIQDALKRAMPQAQSIKPITVDDTTIYVGTAREAVRSYARVVKKDILCEVCADVAYVQVIDQEGLYRNFTLIKPFESYGREIDATQFLRQFIGKSYHQPIVGGANVDTISGATKSCMKFIEGLNENERIFSRFFDDPAFDANFRTGVCFLEQAEIELAVTLYNRDHRKSPGDVKDAVPYCPDGKLPVCPAGGTYMIIQFNDIPRVMCTVHGLDPQSSMIH